MTSDDVARYEMGDMLVVSYDDYATLRQQLEQAHERTEAWCNQANQYSRDISVAIATNSTLRDQLEVAQTKARNFEIIASGRGDEVERLATLLEQAEAKLAAAEARVKELVDMCAQIYPVVGALADSSNTLGTEEVDRVLDNLSEACKVHEDFLPFHPQHTNSKKLA